MRTCSLFKQEADVASSAGFGNSRSIHSQYGGIMTTERKGHIRISSFGNSLGISGEDIVLIPMSQLHDFKDHPFHVHEDESMEKLTESVREQGVLVPILIRKLEESYEIIAGHRRKHAAELAGFVEIPAIIKQLDDDEAVIAMVDSNLQREEILPSEKAFSYRMKLEALKRQGKRNDLTSGQNDQKLNARRQVAEEAGESETALRRYLRLTELVPGILDMVDRRELAVNIGAELSFLKMTEQELLLEAIRITNVRPSLPQTARLRKMSEEEIITLESVRAVLSEEPPKERRFVMKSKKLSEYFPEETTQEEIEKIIFGLLEQWRSSLSNGETA